jgi:hypothetical protein
MVDFRRWITAIAVLALFAGLASAQITIGPPTGAGAGPLTCSATVSVPPQLRAEGLTELIGDIVLTCTGGIPIAPGQVIPTANITVSLQTQVTSRILGGTGTTGASEALLLIDEPGASATTAIGPGAQNAQLLCSSSSVGAGAGGCVQAVDPLGQSGSCSAVSGNTCTAATTAPVTMFQGLVNSNQVTFNGVPINPPVTGGTARVFRITNVRANVAALGGGGLAGTTQLVASISISGSTSLPINNPVQIAGFVQSGLSVAVRKTTGESGFTAAALPQCADQDKTGVAVLRYTENFGTAFKTRVAPTATYNGTGGGTAVVTAVTQNVPGNIYNSESGFVSGTGPANAGLADYGTRLKATFTVPAGVRIFVSTTNITSSGLANGPVPAPGPTDTTSYAKLVISETAPDSNGFPPLVSSTTTVGSTPVTPLAELNVVGGVATAVWEVVNTNPSQAENFYFGVWTSWTGNPAAPSPVAGGAKVNMSYAPTPPAFAAADGGKASATLTIPRFVDNSTATDLLSVAVCNTVLLYPYVTNQGGFDTGLAIANTSTDPFGTKPQAGTCALNWYGDKAPTTSNTPSIASGTVYSFLTSASATGFQGYLIATCNFQLAHGFAFISDLGARNLAMGYLALVLPTGSAKRDSGNLSPTPGTTAIEGVAH